MVKINIELLLCEAPIDVWLKRNPNINRGEAQPVFDQFQKLSSSIHVPDATRYTFDKLKLTVNAVQHGKEFGLKSAELKWFSKEINENPDVTEETLKEDYFPVLKFFALHRDKFQPLHKYKDISELSMGMQALRAEKVKPVSEEEKDIFFSMDGWSVAMPHNTAASCELGTTDGVPDTTWCTARTGDNAQNLFLSYTARNTSNMILFYVFQPGVDARENPNAKLSIGFINGKPHFDGKFGGITVNAKNAGLSKSEFEDLLGEETAEIFLEKMEEKAAQHEGKHPAKKEIEALTQNLPALQVKVQSFRKKDEQEDFVRMALHSPTATEECVRYLLSFVEEDKYYHVREALRGETFSPGMAMMAAKGLPEFWASLARHRNMTPEAARILSTKPSLEILFNLANNVNTPPDVLERLGDLADYDIDHYGDVKQLYHSENIPPQIAEQLVTADNAYEIFSAMQIPNLSETTFRRLENEILEKLHEAENAPLTGMSFDDEEQEKPKGISEDLEDLRFLVNNPRLSEHFLQEIINLNLRFNSVYVTMAANRNLPEKIAAQLAAMNKAPIWSRLAGNPSVTTNVIRSLFDPSNTLRPTPDVTWRLMSNPSTPSDVLEKLATMGTLSGMESLLKHPNLTMQAAKKVYDRNLQDPQIKAQAYKAYLKLGGTPITEVNLLKAFVLKEIGNLNPATFEKQNPMPAGNFDADDTKNFGEESLNGGQARMLQNRIAKMLANDKFHFLGEGSSRTTFAIGSKRVLKLAKNVKGIAQNRSEVEIFTDPKTKPIVAKIFDFAKDYSWVVAESVRSISQPDDFKEIAGFSYGLFMSFLTFFKSSGYEGSILRLRQTTKMLSAASQPERLSQIEHLEQSSFIHGIVGLLKNSNSYIKDFEALEHWGITADRRLVSLDYGATEEVYDKFYKRN